MEKVMQICDQSHIDIDESLKSSILVDFDSDLHSIFIL